MSVKEKERDTGPARVAESSQAATNPTCGCISGRVGGRSFPRPVAHRDRPPAPAPRGDRAEPSASSPRPQAPSPCLPMLQGKVSGTWIPGPSRHPLRFKIESPFCISFLSPGWPALSACFLVPRSHPCLCLIHLPLQISGDALSCQPLLAAASYRRTPPSKLRDAATLSALK